MVSTLLGTDRKGRPHPQLARYIGILNGSEQELADAFTLLADRHSRNAEVRDVAAELAKWSSRHVQALNTLKGKYGLQPSAHPQRIRSALLYGARMGELGLLQDLQDVSLLANQVRLTWTALEQAAVALHDAEMERLCDEAGRETDRQIAWLCTEIKHTAPQALTVAPNRLAETAASLPKHPSIAALPDPVWAPLAGGALTLLVGALSRLVGRPWLLPSLGPSAYLQAESPPHPNARLYNTVVGHLAGLGAGLLAVSLLGAGSDPVVLERKQLTTGRMAASVIATVLTLLVTPLLKATHPPAAATALLAAQGSIKTRQDVLNAIAGAALLGTIGEGLRRLRLKGPTAAFPKRA